MISDTITQKIGEALKARDKVRLSTLRMLSSALNYENIAKQHKLVDLEEIVVVRREMKKRTDMIDSLKSALGKTTSAGGDDEINSRIQREEQEINILKEYLPIEMPDVELIKIVDEAIKSVGAVEMKDMGKVMAAVTAKVAGKADGKRISDIVRSKLGG